MKGLSQVTPIVLYVVHVFMVSRMLSTNIVLDIGRRYHGLICGLNFDALSQDSVYNPKGAENL